MSKRTKGIFCLEGDWSNDLKRPFSVRPVLEMLDQWETNGARHIYHDVATADELWYYLKKWRQKRFESHPILFLAFHGIRDGIRVGDGRTEITIDDIENVLEGQCAGRIVHFGSCEVMDIHGHRIRRFLRRTRALAVSGYRNVVDWNQSAAFELLMLAAMQEGAQTVAGIKKIRKTIARNAHGLEKALNFRILPRDPVARRAKA